ncbi:hypothetical protein Hanom_Chr12g01071491 [Helianthus anomalus]
MCQFICNDSDSGSEALPKCLQHCDFLCNSAEITPIHLLPPFVLAKTSSDRLVWV